MLSTPSLSSKKLDLRAERAELWGVFQVFHEGAAQSGCGVSVIVFFVIPSNLEKSS